MSATHPLSGATLISCAKSNASFGLNVAADRCGFGQDIPAFQTALREACQELGIEPQGLQDLEASSTSDSQTAGVEISPDTYSQL